MSLKRFVPRYRAFEVPDGRISSMRWAGFGWDHFEWKNGTRYTQWGRRLPLNFICRFKESEAPPTFVLGVKWKIIQRRRGMVAGVTSKPLEVGKFWRTVDGSGRSQGLVRVLLGR